MILADTKYLMAPVRLREKSKLIRDIPFVTLEKVKAKFGTISPILQRKVPDMSDQLFLRLRIAQNMTDMKEQIQD